MQECGFIEIIPDLHLNYVGPGCYFSPSLLTSGYTAGGGCRGCWLNGSYILWNPRKRERAPKSPGMVTAAMKLKDTPWKKSYDKPRHHIQKQRHHFANKGPLKKKKKERKVHLVRVMIFPGVMYGCENWTTKKAERGRIDAFPL